MEEFYEQGIRGFKHQYDQPYNLNTNSISIDSSNIEKSLEIAKKFNCAKLMLVGEYNMTQVSFFENHDLSFVKGVSINRAIEDLSPLYSIGDQITHLTLDTSKLIDFNLAEFPNLEFLGCEWSKKIRNLNSCGKLKRLKLRKFPDSNLLNFEFAARLEKLELINNSLTDLRGVSKLKNLRILDLDSSRKLITLEGLGDSGSELEFIRIYSAPNLYNADQIGGMQKLKNLQLSRIKKLKSLKFLDSIDCLDLFAIHKSNVKVEDEDFSPVERMLERSKN